MPVVGKLGMEYLCSQNWRLMIIETEHLIIRDFQEKDAVGLLEYLSHPRVNCFVSERLCSEESALAYIQYSKGVAALCRVPEGRRFHNR